MNTWRVDFKKIVNEVDMQYAALKLNFEQIEAAREHSEANAEQTHKRLVQHKHDLNQLCAEKKHKIEAFYVSVLRGPTLMAARIVMANAC